MVDEGSPDAQPLRARKAPREDTRPQGVVERQGTISGYLVRRAQQRRQRFLSRAQSVPIRMEILRALFLTGCVFVDLLVIPEAIFLIPGVAGWSVTAVGLVVALWLEGHFYMAHFVFPDLPRREE